MIAVLKCTCRHNQNLDVGYRLTEYSVIIIIIVIVVSDRFTYEVAPVFTLMEDVVLRRMLAKVGWPDGEGMFAPGT